MERLFGAMRESSSYPILRLSAHWQDIMLNPAILDLFFTLYWKVRTNPHLAHHARNCLVQLAGLSGRVINMEDAKLQYVSNYVERFIDLTDSIDIIDQEADAFTNIIKKICTSFRSSLHYLSTVTLISFREKIARLTCLFIKGAAQEESVIIILYIKLLINFLIK